MRYCPTYLTLSATKLRVAHSLLTPTSPPSGGPFNLLYASIKRIMDNIPKNPFFARNDERGDKRSEVWMS